MLEGLQVVLGLLNMQRTARRHPQVCWNHYLLLIGGLDCGQWTLSLGYLYVQMSCNAIFTCVDCLTKYTVLTACTLGVGELSAK